MRILRLIGNKFLNFFGKPGFFELKLADNTLILLNLTVNI